MENPRHWRLRAQRYRLEGSICAGCGRLLFPPRLRCPQCSAQPMDLTGPRLSNSPAQGNHEGELVYRYRLTERIMA